MAEIHRGSEKEARLESLMIGLGIDRDKSGVPVLSRGQLDEIGETVIRELQPGVLENPGVFCQPFFQLLSSGIPRFFILKIIGFYSDNSWNSC
jgi:hypothetical protein